MKTNILSEILVEHKCALCQSGSVQNHVVHLTAKDTRQIRLCDLCVDRLRKGVGTNSCGGCGKFAEYGTWKLERISERGNRNAVDFQRVPEYRLLCPVHFDERYEDIQNRARQLTLNDWLDK